MSYDHIVYIVKLTNRRYSGDKFTNEMGSTLCKLALKKITTDCSLISCGWIQFQYIKTDACNIYSGIIAEMIF